MNIETISKAEAEAREFIKRCKAVRKSAKEDNYCFFGCQETGALRRQSMELTRALADLRKPWTIQS